MSSDPLQSAREQHRRGLFAEAIAAYETFLADNPRRGDVWHMKAMAEHQAGRMDASWNSVTRALEEAGEQPAMQLFAGMVAQDRGDLAAAEERFTRAAALKPGWAPPHANRGQVLLDLGRAAEALEAFRAAASLDANNARTWNNIGLALLSLERFDEAQRAFDHAVSIDPSLAMAHFNLGRVHKLRGDNRRALEHAHAAAQADARLTDAHLLLGDLYGMARNAEAAERSLAAAVRSAPTSAKARNAYAEHLASVGRPAEAREMYRVIWRDNPQDLKAALGASLLLPQVYHSRDELLRWRSDYLQGLERLEAAKDSFHFRSARDAMLQARWTNFYLAYQGMEDVRPQSRFGDFMRDVLAPALPDLARPRPKPARRERLRVGFCSHFFFNCTAGRYFASWIRRLDRRRFESYVYYTNEWVADDTRAIAADADRFMHLPGRSPDLVARHIAGDELDVLVYPELGMHTDTFALGSLRLAPVQVAGWGHPVTTGLPHIDWFLSSAPMEPADAQSHYRERLALLPGLGTNYALPQTSATGGRAEFGLPEGDHLYLVPQSLFKIHPDNDELFAEIMARDPRGRLILFAAPHDAITIAYGARLAMALAAHGLKLEDRALFLPYVAHHQYLRVNQLCDVMLDTMHWSGGNTSLDAIACGLPVVTLPGRFMRGRQSAAMLGIAGVPELVVGDAAAYAEKALALAADPDMRADIARRMREGHAELFGRDEPIRALEDFLRKAAS